MTITEQIEPEVTFNSVQHAIAAVMSELPNIGKDDRSPEGYQYRGIEQVTKHAQPLFAKHGVVISPRATITDVRPSPAMKEGWQDVFMSVEWTITGPDGSSIVAQTTGIGRDKSDKGANKAQTQAFKYLLLHLLCIADGKDDSDTQTYEHDRQETEPPLSAALVERVELLPDDLREKVLARLAPFAGLSEPVTLEELADWPVSLTDAVQRTVVKAEQTAAERAANEQPDAALVPSGEDPANG